MKRTKKITRKADSKLFIEELERPATAGVVTTLAVGEECFKGGVTTLAVGEEAWKA